MNLPSSRHIQRCLADFAGPIRAGFCDPSFCVSLGDVGYLSLPGRSSSHLNHTPSPDGQQRALPLLPAFWENGIGRKQVTTGPSEIARRCSVGPGADKAKGTGPCPANRISPRPQIRRNPERPCAPCASPFLLVVALRPVAARWVNRPLQGAPSAPVQRQSPAAVCCRVPPSARRATSPIASSIPASVRDTDTFAPVAERFTRSFVEALRVKYKGDGKCRQRISSLQSSHQRALRPVAVHLVNRRLVALRSAQVLPRSRAAISAQALRLARAQTCLRAKPTWPIATDLTNLDLSAHLTRKPDFVFPAQLLLSRGFRVYPKTQKDSSCSKKS